MQVFISHVAEDEKLVRELADALEKAGFTVWNPASILPGDNPARAAAEALESSELMVVLFRRGAAGSFNVRQEVQYALTQGQYRGRVVPVLMGFTTVQAGSDVPWVLLGMDPIWAPSSSPDLRKIVERVSVVAREDVNAA